MPTFMRLRTVQIFILCLLALTSSSLLAQDEATEIPAEITPSVTPTEIATETPTQIPTEMATATATETATETPSEIPATETIETIAETPTMPVTVEATATITAVVPPEPALSLLTRELFEAEPLVGWTLPSGWTRTAVSAGFALRVNGLEAGAYSTATSSGSYYNLAVMGSFTFSDNNGAAQLIVRDSSAGSYVAQVDANGLVTLAKHDGAGAIIASWNAPATTATVHNLRLSAMGGVLRVTVDNIEVLAVEDALPLPPGTIKVGAKVETAEGQTASGTILFDDFFVWVPSIEMSLYAPAPLAPTPIPTATLPIIPAPSEVSGKSTIPQPENLIAGPLATTNDDFANSEMVVIPFSSADTTIDNNEEGGEPDPSCSFDFNISRTAWYTFTPPVSGASSEPILITTVGSDFDTMIAVYTGTWGSLNEVGCSDDVAGVTQAQLTTTFNDGVTYYIQLGGYNGSSGNFSLAIIRPTDTLVPGTPVISSSAASPSTPVINNGKTNLSQPVVAWNSIGAVIPFSYEIQVSTVNNFSTTVATAIVYEPNRFYEITPALSAGQVYYWRVRAHNFLTQSSAWSTGYSFTVDQVAPPAPSLTAPTLNGVVTNLRPTFSWQPVTDVNRYNVRVTTNFSCTTLVSGTFDTQVTTTSYIFPDDLPQGEYWFCVQAKDIAGNWSGFAEKRRFIVNISLTPANNGIVVVPAPATTADLKFTWTAVAGATYRIIVSADSSFSVNIIDDQVSGTTYTLPSQPFGMYYWRMSVNGNYLPASLARVVTISPPLPAAPAIQTVAALPGAVKNDGATNDTTPVLDWTIPSNWVPLPLFQSINYEVQLSTNNSFTALVSPPITGISTANYEWTATTLPVSDGTTYYWRVRAMTNLVLYGAWSAPFSFKLDTTNPNPPASLTAPADNFVSTSARPAFSWTAPIGGASSYRFEISTDGGDFDPPAIPDAIVTTPHYTPTVSLPQGTYYWQVWASDAAGNESLSATGIRTLTVDYRTAPATNYTVTTATSSNVAFSWMLATGAPIGTTYAIELDYDLDGNPDSNLQPIPTTTATAFGLAQGDYQYRLVVSNGFGTSGWRPFFVSPPLPGAPGAPFTPANNSITADTTPQLGWAVPTINGGTVTGYSVEISTTSNFSAPIAGSPFNAGATTAFTPPALPDNKYYWKVRAYNSLGAYGGYSGTLSFTVDTTSPNPPASLTAPADNFVSTTARPAFSWTAQLGSASTYRFELSTDSGDFDPPAIPDAIVTTTRYTPTVSLPQGTYYWQVWASDAAGNESLSATGIRTLTVDYRTAPITNHVAFTATNSNITFTWTLVTGAPVGTTYQIEIDSDFNDAADTTLPAVTTGSTTATGLAQGDYQYRLVVGNGFGTSDWRTFLVSPPLPGIPVAPFTPVNATFINDTTPTLQWNAPTVNASNVVAYIVEIATDKNFTSQVGGSPFDAGATTSFTPSPLAGNTYYWRVRARGAFNLFGNYTAAMTFTVDITAPPNAPNMNAPLDNTMTNLPRPTFTWGKATDATRYVIEIDDEINFNNPVFHTATVVTTSYALPTNTYLRQGIYYWRVWTMDAAGNLNPGPITPYTLNVNYSKTPTDNAVIMGVTGAKVTFTWAAVPITPITANTLRVQVANDSNFTLIEHMSPLLASNIVSYSTPSALDHGEYFWRVVVTGHPALPNALANSFTISPAAPPAPTLSAPATFTNDTTPVFNWNAVSSASGANVTGYELQLSTSNNFAVLVGGNTIMIAGQATVSYEWVSELPTTGQVYYARIRAKNSLNVYGNWSAVRSFTLDTTAPGVPALTAPGNNKTVATLTPTFTWTAVPGAARYEIRYNTTPNLVSTTPVNVTTTSHRPSNALTVNNYYWEVRAIDAAGNALDWDNGGIWDSISNKRTVKITG